MSTFICTIHTKFINKKDIWQYYPLYIFNMDQRGVEPLSESLFTPVSSITVCILLFPLRCAHRQAHRFGSFIFLLPAQSFAERVPHLNDAGYRGKPLRDLTASPPAQWATQVRRAAR